MENENKAIVTNDLLGLEPSENDDYFDDEKPAISSEELQAEFEKLQQDTREKLIKSDECLLLKKLSILRKFNEINLGMISLSNINIQNTEDNKMTRESSTSTSSGSSNINISPNFNVNSYSNISPLNIITKSKSFKQRHLSFTNSNLVNKSVSLLVGEEIILRQTNARYLHKLIEIEGEFQITKYRIIFIPKSLDFFEENFILPESFQIPHTYIHSVTKKKECSQQHKYTLKFQIRDRPSMTICFNQKTDSEEIFNTINDLINPKSFMGFFAFKYNQKYENTDFKENENGWLIYQHLLEYIRMGLQLDSEECKYRLYIQELHGDLCETYPNFIYIHKNVTNEDITKVASFRSKKRFPALVWQSPFNNSSLWRSSQAKTGLIDKRSQEDETYFSLLSVETEKFHIYDARPYINAFANKMKGYGFENTDHYKNAQMTFCDIENIHAVRQAYHKMKIISQLPLEGYENWLQDLHLTNWLQIIAKIIRSSINIASSLMENATVLIHCSDGWDRTAQLCSLSQIIIDPFYRTLMGLIVIIEKEWISYGHQFAHRCGHNVPKQEDQISPIFIQWLDTVHQLIFQYPTLFEFNNDLLLFLAFHVTSCQYGTFLMNSEKDRVNNFIKFKTVSIWTDVIANKTRFTNSSYDELKSSKTILTPSCAFYKLRLWEEHFLRWNPYYVMNNYKKLTSPFL